jgi:hypothetical protein
MNNWIKLHRKIAGKAFYNKDSEKVHLWFHILLNADHDGKEEMFGGKPIKCFPGQFVTSRNKLSLETGIQESKIQRILTYFEKTEQQIEQQNSNTNRLITVCNWDVYQKSEQQNEQRPNSDRTATEQQKPVPQNLQKFILVSAEKVYDPVAFLNENSRLQVEAMMMNQGLTEENIQAWFNDNAGGYFTGATHILNSIRKFQVKDAEPVDAAKQERLEYFRKKGIKI